MNRIITVFASFLVCLCFVTCRQSPETLSSKPLFQKNTVWDSGEEGVEGYRIPGIVVTSKGAVLAFAESRVDYSDETPNHIVLKRSTDEGITWSPTFYIEKSDGNFWAAHQNMIDPADVTDKKEVWTNIAPIADYTTGRIFFFYALSEGAISGKNMQRYTRVFYKYSDDDGLSWSDRTEVTDLLNVKKDGTPNVDEQGNRMTDINGFPCDYHGRAFHMPGPGHGIQLKSGRLLLQLWNRTALGTLDNEQTLVQIPVSERKYGICTIYSDDHGKTWKYGSSFGEDLHMNESRMAESDNGDVYINARYTVEGSNAYRAVAVSHDGGINWTDARIDEGFPFTNQCDGGLVKLTCEGKSCLLYSNNNSPEGRKNLTVRLSYDDGQTWPVRKTVDEGAALYSDLAVLPDKSILVLYETGKNKPLYCVRFNIKWLTDDNK